MWSDICYFNIDNKRRVKIKGVIFCWVKFFVWYWYFFEVFIIVLFVVWFGLFVRWFRFCNVEIKVFFVFIIVCKG